MTWLTTPVPALSLRQFGVTEKERSNEICSGDLITFPCRVKLFCTLDGGETLVDSIPQSKGGRIVADGGKG